jgi:WhiB family redox-sensing transcriptional regulator
MADLTWQHRGACRSIDIDVFVPTGERGPSARAAVDTAKAICRRCPVADQCLTWALDVGDDWAILGGTTRDERRAMRRQAHRQVVTAAAWRTCAALDCDVEFLNTTPDKRYCSPRCERRHALQLERVRQCANPECGRTFVPHHASALSCSTTCSDRTVYLRRRDLVRELVAA